MTHAAPYAVDTKATKAIVGAAVSGALAFLAPLGVTLHAGEPITGVTWFDSVVAALGFAAIVFPSVYYPVNAPK
jgi:hypothetical protein